MTDLADDVASITEIVADMFDAISWSPDNQPDFERFAKAVHECAVLVPSARPIVPSSIADFVDRMRSQHSAGSMETFDERPLKTSVLLFGNMAVALGGYEMRVNGGAPSRGANAFLLAREDGHWRIVSMAWDSERDGVRLSEHLA